MRQDPVSRAQVPPDVGISDVKRTEEQNRQKRIQAHQARKPRQFRIQNGREPDAASRAALVARAAGADASMSARVCIADRGAFHQAQGHVQTPRLARARHDFPAPAGRR